MLLAHALPSAPILSRAAHSYLFHSPSELFARLPSFLRQGPAHEAREYSPRHPRHTGAAPVHTGDCRRDRNRKRSAPKRYLHFPSSLPGEVLVAEWKGPGKCWWRPGKTRAADLQAFSIFHIPFSIASPGFPWIRPPSFKPVPRSPDPRPLHHEPVFHKNRPDSVGFTRIPLTHSPIHPFNQARLVGRVHRRDQKTYEPAIPLIHLN